MHNFKFFSFNVANVIDSTKLEKPLRDLFKEAFPELKEFFRRSNNIDGVNTVPVSPIVEKAPQISVTSVIDPIQIPSHQKEKEVPVKQKKKVKKRPPIVTLDEEMPDSKTLIKSNAGWDSSLSETIEKHIMPLSDDIKEELRKLENVIKEGNSDGNVEIEDAFGAILRNVLFLIL